jgi:hypothetical protein
MPTTVAPSLAIVMTTSKGSYQTWVERPSGIHLDRAILEVINLFCVP